jgi:hypothetical protein
MGSSEVVTAWVDCRPPSWFDKLTMRAPGVDLAQSQSKGEVRTTDLPKVL